MNRLYGYDEAAEVLGASVSARQRWVMRRQLEHVKIGPRVLFEETVLEAVVAAGRVPARDPGKQKREE